MPAILAFALTLLLAVSLSKLAARSVLSTTVIFLLAGFAVARLLHLARITPHTPMASELAELALFTTLFTDGMRASARELAHAWRLPGRALLLGLPITIAGTAVLAHAIIAMPWHQAWLMGAVLGPTDPVFAAAIVRRTELSSRLRSLLNVESGLNDGLALPVVLALVSTVDGLQRLPGLALSAAGGLLLGAALSMIAHSSTDVLTARWILRGRDASARGERRRRSRSARPRASGQGARAPSAG
jgi:NhaP-type Na+/H+ or K+/H+ antiporter